jgi:hypothetical protein
MLCLRREVNKIKENEEDKGEGDVGSHGFFLER